MRRLAFISIATCLFATAAAADSAENCAIKWSSGQYQAMTYADFMDICVTSLANGTNYGVNDEWGVHGQPANATARCNDGTRTTNRWPQDACVGHSGIDLWLQSEWP